MKVQQFVLIAMVKNHLTFLLLDMLDKFFQINNAFPPRSLHRNYRSSLCMAIYFFTIVELMISLISVHAISLNIFRQNVAFLYFLHSLRVAQSLCESVLHAFVEHYIKSNQKQLRQFDSYPPIFPFQRSHPPVALPFFFRLFGPYSLAFHSSPLSPSLSSFFSCQDG